MSILAVHEVETLVYWILGAMLTATLIMSGAWGKAVLAKLDSMDNKLGIIQTTSAVHGVRLDNLEKAVADLKSRPLAEKE